MIHHKYINFFQKSTYHIIIIIIIYYYIIVSQELIQICNLFFT